MRKDQPKVETHRQHPSLYNADYSYDTGKRNQEFRSLSNDLEQGKSNTFNGKKLTTDLGFRVAVAP